MPKLKIGNILFNILLIITVAAVGFTVFNLAFSAKGYAVTSDSMKDTFKRGDAVFSQKVDFDELKVGDVITVGSKDGKEFFTHRIVGIDEENKTVSTKGDNNPEKDPMDTPAQRIVGKVWYSVPLLGFFSIAFGEANKIKLLIIFALTAVLLTALNTIFAKIQKRKTEV